MRLIAPCETVESSSYNLQGKPWTLSTDGKALRVKPAEHPSKSKAKGPTLRPWRAKNGARYYILLSASTARILINGLKPLPIAVLQDRDELTIDGQVIYYSAEALPEVVRFKRPPAAEPTHCARCSDKLSDGQEAVQCPRCSLWYHHDHDATKCCWRYDKKCSSCDHPTDEKSLWKPTPIPEKSKEDLSYEERRNKRQREAALRTA